MLAVEWAKITSVWYVKTTERAGVGLSFNMLVKSPFTL